MATDTPNDENRILIELAPSDFASMLNIMRASGKEEAVALFETAAAQSTATRAELIDVIWLTIRLNISMFQALLHVQPLDEAGKKALLAVSSELRSAVNKATNLSSGVAVRAVADHLGIDPKAVEQALAG